MKHTLAVSSVFAIILVTFLTTQAQMILASHPEYRLRELTIEDMIYEVLPITHILHGANPGALQAREIVWALEDEFLFRYGDTATFDQLMMAANHLAEPIAPIMHPRCCQPAIDMNAWLARLIQRWLIENPTQFTAETPISIQHMFRISPQPYDFNGDQTPEWILDVEWLEFPDQRERYRNLLTAVQTTSSYRINPIPVPYVPTRVAQSRTDEGLRDINGDGVIDWLFRVNQPAPGSNAGFLQSYYALTWRNERMERIYVGSGSPTDIDDDGALEFVERVIGYDNWMCGTESLLITEWDGAAYANKTRVVEQTDCTARHAEEAMWSGDFATAAALYARYIRERENDFEQYAACNAANGGNCPTNLMIEIYRYFVGRRILAYALMGDQSRVRDMLEEVAADSETANWVRYGFVQALVDTGSTDPETLCQAAYTYFAESFRGAYAITEAIPFFPGELRENISMNPGTNPFLTHIVNPAKAGCDISLFSGEPTLTPTSTPTQSPTYAPPTPDTRSQVEQLGAQRFYPALFRMGEYNTILDVTERIASDDLDYPRALYWQALTLEVTGQPQAALEAFVTLYLNAPGTWWGWLAGMHLVPAERVSE
jgi:hypothetical protein